MLMNTAVILAGGKSNRMGFDKQFIKHRGKLIVEYQLEALKKLFKEIIIVTNKPEEYKGCDCKLVSDELPDFGPLGGIHAALKASSSIYSYFIACDMPFINTEYILYMQDRLKEIKAEPKAVVTRFGAWIEPFNAYYSKELLPDIEQAYIDNQRKVSRVLDRVQVLYIDEAEARRFSKDWDMFININTKEDLCKLQEKHKGQ